MIRSLFILLCFLTLNCEAQPILDSFNINIATGQWTKDSTPDDFFDYNGKAVFLVNKDSILGRQYKETDGTYYPTTININNYKRDAATINQISLFTEAYGDLYFSAEGGLWKYDGNTANKISIVDAKNNPIELYPHGHYATVDSYIICEKWDQHQEGISVYNINTNIGYYIDSTIVIFDFVVYKGNAYFNGQKYNDTGSYLYQFTPSTKTLTKINIKFPYVLIEYNGTLYFFAEEKLYEYNLNTMSSPQIRDSTYPFNNNTTFPTGSSGSSYKRSSCIWQDALYFSASVNSGKKLLYKHNLLNKKTTLVDSNLYDIQDVVVYNDKLFFGASDSIHGRELFMYDGINSPSLVADIFKGTWGSRPYALTVVNNRLFFAAESEIIGREVFVYYDPTTSIQNISSGIAAILYPNPTNGDAMLQLSLQQTEAINISLTNLSGQRVYQTTAKEYQQGTHNITLPTAQLSTGMYLYHITDKDGITLASGRIEKQ